MNRRNRKKEFQEVLQSALFTTAIVWALSLMFFML